MGIIVEGTDRLRDIYTDEVVIITKIDCLIFDIEGLVPYGIGNEKIIDLRKITSVGIKNMNLHL